MGVCSPEDTVEDGVGDGAKAKEPAATSLADASERLLRCADAAAASFFGDADGAK